MATIKEKLYLLNPLYWPAWLGLGLLWLINHLPYRLQISVGKSLGRLFYLFPSKLKRITEINIRLCFPTLSKAEQQLLVKDNFASLGAALIEAGMAWWLPDAKLESLLHITGLEHVEKALAEKHGILLLSPHFFCFEIIGRLIAMKYSFSAMFRPHKKALIAFIHQRFRHPRGHYIPRNKMRTLFTALANNEFVWYAYDVDAGPKHSVFAPFFGIQTASLTAVSRIAANTGAKIVPIRFYRRQDGLGYDIILSAALDNFPSDNAVNDATRLNHLLEQAIREHPEQYMWQYKRFKTRPLGEKRFY